jgi:hypothetical protein
MCARAPGSRFQGSRRGGVCVCSVDARRGWCAPEMQHQWGRGRATSCSIHGQQFISIDCTVTPDVVDETAECSLGWPLRVTTLRPSAVPSLSRVSLGLTGRQHPRNHRPC